MARYRKKPVVIEAFQLGVDQPHKWWKEAVDAGRAAIADDRTALIETLEGTHRADQGDFIICGVKGELYPCKPDIFEATYERVSP